ncbi:uncharacterized protein TRAVEDRAFT_29384 [Trametes versicolor FP-101664 SS1]|uniref:uncharacterized protein n=1 Tax=Trametes versicolor (strain FP-101664) TaxID=717944 RepID=UPI0004623656|nr:uncharacterized protein TRAVEDRAFT_29384 [Trametes versicolor FP-101664 SS1]EIW57204.1 hypothetical protein TRAVEDRAFT_29384 [Trametes versicolor FP-101664 SS1]
MGSGRKGGSRCTTSSQNGSRRWPRQVSAHSTGFQLLLYNLSRLIRPHKPLSNPASSTTHSAGEHNLASTVQFNPASTWLFDSVAGPLGLVENESMDDGSDEGPEVPSEPQRQS